MINLRDTQDIDFSTEVDEKLWSYMRMGNLDALSEQYNRHAKKLYAYGRKFTSDTEIIKDCIHDLFYDLLTKPESVSETACVKSYLMKALRRRLAAYDKKYVHCPLNQQHDLQLMPSIEDQLIEDDTIADTISCMQKAIAQLTKRQREIVYLKYYYSFDNQFIAEIMTLNYQAVCNLTSRSLKSIRKFLTSQRTT